MKESEVEPGGECESSNRSINGNDESRREFSAKRSRYSRSRSRSHSSSRSYSRSRSRSSDSSHRRRRYRKRRRGGRSGSRSASSHSSRSYSRSSSCSSYLGSRSCSRSPSSREASRFQERDPRDRSMRHRWGNNVWIVGEKVKDLTFHVCDICDKPIVVYGRLKPCNHVFCFTCASALSGTCHRCKVPYTSCDRCLLGGIFQCTEDSQCRRTYLSQRDLQAHINHRHKPKNTACTTVGAPATTATTKASVVPAVTTTAQPPPVSAAVAPPSFLVSPPTNFSIPPPPFLSTPPSSVAPPPANALLVAPSLSQQPSHRVAGGGGGDTTGNDVANSAATIAALAAAIQANPSAATATAVSLNVAPLCPTSTRLPSTHPPSVPSHLVSNSLWSSGNHPL
ncbi:E3 ubiquitin-protein ligase Hakai [Taenia crassiceps]|uniref:E3 ubiquitin-protein ligase Hakai n=1 Tax=Taenia crassiceps TaxID=6207 RepID=A0ABR4QJW2_9CEST